MSGQEMIEILVALLADQQGKKITSIEIKGGKDNEDNI